MVSLLLLWAEEEKLCRWSIDRPGMERPFLLSSTHGAEMPGLGAFIGAVNIYRADNVTDKLWDYGKKLKTGLSEVAKFLILRITLSQGPAVSFNCWTPF